MEIWGKSIPAFWNSQCRGPEAEGCMLYWNCSKGACVAGAVRMSVRGADGRKREKAVKSERYLGTGY